MKRLSFMLAIGSAVLSNAYCDINVSSNEPITYSKDRDEISAKGDAVITFDNFTLRADEVTCNRTSSAAKASGDVMADYNGIFITSDSAEYDPITGVVSTKNSKAKVRDYLLSADSVDATADVQTGTNVSAYYVDPRCVLAPSLFAKKVRVVNSDILQMNGVYFRISDVPVLRLPDAEVGLDDVPFYMEHDYGINEMDGVFFKTDSYFGIKRWLKVGGLLDIYTGRGVLFGPAVKVDYAGADNKIFADTKFGFIRDHRGRRRRKNVRKFPKDREFFDFKYRQHHKDSIDIISNIAWLGDEFVEKDFRKKLSDPSFQPDSFVEADYRGGNYVASVFTRFDPNRFHGYTSRLPEVRIDYLPSTIFDTDFVQNWHVSVAHLKNRTRPRRAAGWENIVGSRADIYYGISLPLSHGDIFTFRPVAGAMVIGYDYDNKRAINNNLTSSGADALFQLGFDYEMNFTGYSDYKNEFLGIDGVKHTITPVVQYRVIPKGNKKDGVSSGLDDRPRIDRYAFNTEMPVIDIDDMRNIDEIWPQNTIRVGVKNNLYTRSNSYFPRRLARLDVYQDVLFKRHEEIYFGDRWCQKTFQNAYVNFGIYPFELISFDAYSQIDPDGMRLKKLNTVTSVHEGDVWSVSFSTRYEKIRQRVSKEYGVKLTMRLSSKTTMSFSEKINAINSRCSKYRIGLSTNWGDFWNTEFALTFRDKHNPKGRVQFDWSISTVAF